MLDKMRKNLKSLSIFLWLVIFSFVFFVFVGWGSGKLTPDKSTNTVAWVGNNRILTSDFRKMILDREEMLKERYGQQASKIMNNPQFISSLLYQVIQQNILSMKAEDLGIQATDEEVRDKIMSFPVFKDKKGNFIGYEMYRRILAYNHKTVQEFEDSLRKEIMIDKLRKYVTSGITITPEEAFEEYKNENEKAKIDYFLIKSDKIEINRKISENELKDYFKKHKSEFTIPEKRSIKYVLFSREDYKDEVSIEEEDLKEYYNNNITRFRKPEERYIKRIFVDKSTNNAKEKIEEALKLLKEEGNFSKVAKKYSEDKKADEGGDWGEKEWAYYVTQEERQKINELTEGSISDIVESEKGYSIIYLYKHQPEEVTSFEEAKERIRPMVEYQKIQSKVLEDAKEFNKKLGKKDIETYAKENNYKIKQEKNLSSSDAIKNVDPTGAVAKAVFELKSIGDTTEPIYTFSGAVVAQITDIKPERDAMFDEVDYKIEESYEKELKRKKALKVSKELRESLKTNKKFEESVIYLDSKKDFEINHEGNIPEVGKVDAVEKFVFKADIGSISEPIFTNKGYLIIRLNDKTIMTKEDFRKEKVKIIEDLVESRKESFFLSYLQNLRDEYKVKINNYVLESFTKPAEEQ